MVYKVECYVCIYVRILNSLFLAQHYDTEWLKVAFSSLVEFLLVNFHFGPSVSGLHCFWCAASFR
jgi:hypothetical protein